MRINHEIYKSELKITSSPSQNYDLKDLLIPLKSIEALEFCCINEELDVYISDTVTPYLFFIQPMENLPYDIIKKTDEIKDDYKLFVNSIQKYCPYLTDWSQPDQPWTRAITIANNKIDTIRWVSQLHKPYNFGYPIAYEK